MATWLQGQQGPCPVGEPATRGCTGAWPPPHTKARPPEAAGTQGWFSYGVPGGEGAGITDLLPAGKLNV